MCSTLPAPVDVATEKHQDADRKDRTKNMPSFDALSRVQAILPQLEAILSITGTPGLSFAVIHNGRTLHVSHLGYRDVQARLAPDDQTRYNINSLTKACIAVLIGQEVNRGALAWYSKVKDLVPDFRSSDAIVQEHATVLDLLSHRTGITCFDAPWLQGRNAVLMDRAETLPLFATLPAVQEFRTSFLYNNFGYEILGLILEKTTGQPLSRLLQERLFTPLEMHRTSTSWETADSNVARSYSCLDHLSPVEIPRPQLGRGTLMEAAGGVKSTIGDLISLYKAWLHVIGSQSADGMGPDRDYATPIKECGTIINSHAWLPGLSFREQTYALGWARGQLPGQLGRISQNANMGDEPTVGKGADSRLVVYHHGYMPGSTSVVNLIPDIQSAVIVLQNSSAMIDTADFVGQMAVEALLGVTEPNDYVQLAKEFSDKSLHHMTNIKSELDSRRKPGTSPRSLREYVGTYWNDIHNFSIDVKEQGDGLQMLFQMRDDEGYSLAHYQDDTFSWWMTHNEAASRGRCINDFGPSYYLISFKFEGGTVCLEWAWDPDSPATAEHFRPDARKH